MDDTLFDPQNQTFFIVGSSNINASDPSPSIAISLPVIDAQRVRLASTSINYGVQLGLCFLSLLTSLLLLPTTKLRRPVHLSQVLCLVVSVTRLTLLVLYFPGPLTEYYVAWTRDASGLPPEAYNMSTASSALSVLQLALVEASLMLQSRVLVRTWGVYSPSPSLRSSIPAPSSSSNSKTTALIGKCWWRPPVLFLAVTLAAAAVALRAVWVARYTQALKGHTLPVPLDDVGKASTVISAMSVFYFCGVFFTHLALHLAATRRVLRGKGRKLSIALSLKGGGSSGRGLSSLEILAVGNAILMMASCLFAGLDVAAGPGNTRVLPYDAGSWVQTLVAAGLPLISIAAFYRGSDSPGSSFRRSNRGSRRNLNRGKDHRTSFHFFATGNGTISFALPASLFSQHPRSLSNTDDDSETLGSSMHWSPRVPAGGENVDDLEAGNGIIGPVDYEEIQQGSASVQVQKDPEVRSGA
ncbi:fungal pheromone mating factor STE2 GPCR-domain-containing protein [Daldinia decipiens]|uniref:fungal pheromone mating factor STE2 GPCR-domain-containing protein n=1 Tax=Daldinia decipiens TaxID=326647 RepID=UPI0020C3C48E|nr:fungal pheromone mating factor STE2 GPCR-domain-containing protein [Daldinia decipiens]KAI1655424.1 fungal pheromone mating factor STE2 GPCR-domain-containing protein [Daldinia decipiens]